MPQTKKSGVGISIISFRHKGSKYENNQLKEVKVFALCEGQQRGRDADMRQIKFMSSLDSPATCMMLLMILQLDHLTELHSHGP